MECGGEICESVCWVDEPRSSRGSNYVIGMVEELEGLGEVV